MVEKLVEDMLRPQSLPQGWTAIFNESKGRRCRHRNGVHKSKTGYEQDRTGLKCDFFMCMWGRVCCVLAW